LGWFWWFWVRWEEHTHETPWRQIVPWFAAHILHLSHRIAVSHFTGDATYDHVKILCFVIIAALAAAIWSALDRNRADYAKLYRWVRWYVRFVVALTMLGFGVYKVVPVQMPPPDLATLMQPFGDIAPFRQLVNFMGSSAGYEIFCGLVEMTGGILLLIPGLTSLGAVVTLGALANVFILTTFYDWGVKLGVVHLILLTSFLLLPDVPRILNLFVLNRGTHPERRRPIVQRRWLNYSLWGIQWALGIYIIAMMFSGGIKHVRAVDSVPTSNPLYGIWKVDEFTADGQLRAPLLSDDLRWQRVIFDGQPAVPEQAIATIQDMSGQFWPYVVTADTKNGTLSLRSPGKTEPIGFQFSVHRLAKGDGKAELTYNRVSPDAMILEGPMNGHQLRMTLKKEDRQFIVKTRGFHWIIEDTDVFF
jgi:hypothetical protein